MKWDTVYQFIQTSNWKLGDSKTHIFIHALMHVLAHAVYLRIFVIFSPDGSQIMFQCLMFDHWLAPRETLPGLKICLMSIFKVVCSQYLPEPYSTLTHSFDSEEGKQGTWQGRKKYLKSKIFLFVFLVEVTIGSEMNIWYHTITTTSATRGFWAFDHSQPLSIIRLAQSILSNRVTKISSPCL